MRVTISKEKLLEVLHKNRADHVEIYTSSVEGYKKAIQDSIHTVQTIFDDTQELNIGPLVSLNKPLSYESQYAEAIEMVTWSETEQFTLEQQEFRQYVLDKWSWMNQFVTSNSGYATGDAATTLRSKSA
jgi:hypothetical protein